MLCPSKALIIAIQEGEITVSDKYARIAAVTGATSGIGEATVRKFVAAGFGVVGNGRNGEKLAALEKEFGSAFRGVVGDAADNTVLEQLFISAEEHFGKTFDIVVVNAGRGLDGSVMSADLSQFEDLIRINVTGALALLQKARKENGGYPARCIPRIGSRHCHYRLGCRAERIAVQHGIWGFQVCRTCIG